MRNVRERAIAAGILLSMAGSVGFMIAYATQQSTQWEGFGVAVAFAGLLVAALGWARWILPPQEVTDLRDTYPQPVNERAAQAEGYAHGVAELTRRTWLTRLIGAAFGLFGLAALFPIASLGPRPGDKLFHTRWKRGSRLTRIDGTHVRSGDLNVNAVETVFPEDAIGDAQSVTVLLRVPEGLVRDADRGYLAYSKVCTHAGCPVALYRAADRELVCPCHQSVFDVTKNAAVLSGPADHPLPRLPLETDAQGYLRAAGDFPAPVGPGFWNEG